HFRERGFEVVDTSANQPYDLECTKSGDAFRVEVKGSIGKSSRVHLTRNEVLNARSHRTVLFIVGCIEIDVQSSPPAATGGTIVRQIDNWRPSDVDLIPETYTYNVPRE